jgi:hypothetical protein
MISKGKPLFDPKVFLSKVNGGRAISDYRKDQIVYTQGEPADSVFYIQSGKVKKTVFGPHCCGYAAIGTAHAGKRAYMAGPTRSLRPQGLRAEND